MTYSQDGIKTLQHKMKKMIDQYCHTNRSPVSESNNSLIAHLCERFGTKPLSTPSLSECLTWIIPKAWKVRKACLIGEEGAVIADFSTNPLHVWAHSIPYKGWISRNELEKHLFYSKEHPDWIPYHYRNQYRHTEMDWGFSITYNRYLELADKSYYVEIDSSLDDSLSMDIADIHVKGKNESCILFAAHTCHPGIATDGLTNVAVLCEVAERVKNSSIGLKYSYRFVLGPEFYAAAAFLASASDEEIRNIKGGAYFDMLGNGRPIGWQTSFYQQSYMDKLTDNVMKNYVPDSFKRSYRKLWGNDETFYNGPGYNIPVVGIGGDKFDEYHFDRDNANFVNYEQLLFSVEIVFKMIDVFEKDAVPLLKYEGPLYLSRYNLYIDPRMNRKGYDSIEAIQILADGKNSCLDIAYELDIDFFFVYDFFRNLEEKNLSVLKEYII
jgi:aminopeptidase-like protein